MPPQRRRTDAQRRAEQRNDDKRRGRPRLPASYLTERESELLDEAVEVNGGTKKQAIMAGLRALIEKHKSA